MISVYTSGIKAERGFFFQLLTWGKTSQDSELIVQLGFFFFVLASHHNFNCIAISCFYYPSIATKWRASMAILVLTVLLDDTQSRFERRTPAAFSQLIYGLADVATLSGSPPVAPTCKPVQCDALSILPYVGGESLRQSRLNYIIVKAPWLPPKCAKKTPPTHTSAPRWSAHPRTVALGWDMRGWKKKNGALPRWEHPSVVGGWRVWREWRDWGSEPRLESDLPLPPEAISHPGGWGAQSFFQCKLSIWVFKGQINIIPLH